MSELIDDVLAGVVTARQTMQRQVGKIGEIMERSNQTLLHIENQNNLQSMSTITSPPAVEDPSQNIYNLKPECEQSIVQILEQFQLLMQQTVDDDNNAGSPSALDACLAYRQRAEYLGSSVRKLVAVCDIMNQLKMHVQKMLEQEAEIEEEVDSEDEF